MNVRKILFKIKRAQFNLFSSSFLFLLLLLYFVCLFLLVLGVNAAAFVSVLLPHRIVWQRDGKGE